MPRLAGNETPRARKGGSSLRTALAEFRRGGTLGFAESIGGTGYADVDTEQTCVAAVGSDWTKLAGCCVLLNVVGSFRAEFAGRSADERPCAAAEFSDDTRLGQ